MWDALAKCPSSDLLKAHAEADGVNDRLGRAPAPNSSLGVRRDLAYYYWPGRVEGGAYETFP